MPPLSQSKKTINLLNQEFRRPQKFQFLPKVSFMVTIVYLFSLLCLFGITALLLLQKNSLVKDQEKLSQQLTLSKDSEELFGLLKSRVKAAQSVFVKTSPGALATTNNVVNNLPQGVTLSNVEVDKEGKVGLVVKTERSSGVSDLLSRLKSNNLTDVRVNTLSLASDGSFVVSLNFK